MPSFIFCVFFLFESKANMTRIHPFRNFGTMNLWSRSIVGRRYLPINIVRELHVSAYYPAPEPLYCAYAGVRLSRSSPPFLVLFFLLVEAYLKSLSLNFLQEQMTLAALVFASVLIPLGTWLIHPAFASIPTVAPTA
jgi:hypothetical protein